MNYCPHTTRKYRHGLESPANTPRTVDNPCLCQEREGDSLRVMWTALCRQTARDVVRVSKSLTNPQITLLALIYRIEGVNPESGEGVSAATTTFGYDYNDDRVIEG